jgi:large subunit ribosomal protein L17
MRHRVSGKLFGRTANQRKALLRGLMASLFEHQRIETTLAKAKEAKKLAERIITLGIRGDLHSKRVALSHVPNRSSIAKLFNEIAPRFSGRNGGYLRLVKTRNRVNDGAPMAVLEFVDYEEVRKATEPKKAEAKKTKEKKEEPKGNE